MAAPVKARTALTRATIVKDFTEAFKSDVAGEELAVSLIADLTNAMPNTSIASHGTTGRAIINLMGHARTIAPNPEVLAYWTAVADPFFKAQVKEAKPVAARWIPGMALPVAEVAEVPSMEEEPAQVAAPAVTEAADDAQLFA